MKKAIDTGRIHLLNGRVDRKKADADWDRNTTLSRPSNSVTGNPAGATPKRHQHTRLETTNGHQRGAPEQLTFSEAQTEHEYWKGELARLKVEEAEGRLVDAESVRDEIFKAYRSVRDGIRNIPNRVSGILASETDPATVHRRLIEEIDRVLESLNDDLGSEPR